MISGMLHIPGDYYLVIKIPLTLTECTLCMISGMLNMPGDYYLVIKISLTII
jgi:hypothetical protein